MVSESAVAKDLETNGAPVLILVLVEDGLRDFIFSILLNLKSAVLILVLVEDGLRAIFSN